MVGHKGETSVVGCKVLPICDVMSVSAGSNSGESSDAGDHQQIEGRKSEKRYGVMRMKELIRRAVAAKAQRVGAKACKVTRVTMSSWIFSGSEHQSFCTDLEEIQRDTVTRVTYLGQTISVLSCQVLNIPNRDVTKHSVDNRSSSSSKISFMWDVRSCSSAASVHTNRADQLLVKNFSNLHSKFLNPPSNPNSSEPDQANKKSSAESIDCARNGQWITNDTDFVVLEL